MIKEKLIIYYYNFGNLTNRVIIYRTGKGIVWKDRDIKSHDLEQIGGEIRTFKPDEVHYDKWNSPINSKFIQEYPDVKFVGHVCSSNDPLWIMFDLTCTPTIKMSD